MKAIIINEKNREKLEKALTDGQGKARARRIDTLEELQERIEAGKELLPEELPKKSWAGCLLTIRVGAGKYPAKYNGRPEGTMIEIKFRKDGGAELLNVYRGYCDSGQVYNWIITPAMNQYILATMNCSVKAD